MQQPLALVPGEYWERAYVAWTRTGLQREGIETRSYFFRYDRDVNPLSYSSVLQALLKDARVNSPNRPALIVPAGTLVLPGFGKAAAACLKDRRLALGAPPNGHHLGVGWPDGRFTPIAGHVAPWVIGLTEQQRIPVPERFVPQCPLQRPEGHTAYQTLRRLSPDPAAWEEEIRILDPEQRHALPGGWVYRCNNETLNVAVDKAGECDTLVALASGIKPWLMANQMRKNLKTLLVADASLAQLRFAQEAHAALVGAAASWDEVCDLPCFSSAADSHLLTPHREVFEKIRQESVEWRFRVVFAHLNLVTQAFRFTRLLRDLGAQRPAIWYSNVFQPYLRADLSEHHVGMEASFVDLVRQRFPGVVLFDASSSGSPFARQ